MIYFVSQHEACYVRDEERILWTWYPQAGYYFLPMWQEVPEGTTYEEVVGEIEGILIDKEDLPYN